MKVCPECGSTQVKPAKEIDEWASIEEQMNSSGGDKHECQECGYKGELIGIAETPEEDEASEDKEEDELEAKPAPITKVEVIKPEKSTAVKSGKAQKAKSKKGKKIKPGKKLKK